MDRAKRRKVKHNRREQLQSDYYYRQPWTELTAFQHVLDDEVHRYLNPLTTGYDPFTSDEDHVVAREVMKYLHTESQKQQQQPRSSHTARKSPFRRGTYDEVPISDAERRQCRLWLQSVNKRLDHENGSILENVLTIWELQETEERIGILRDACRQVRLDNHRLDRRLHDLKQQVDDRHQHSITRQRASDFLELITAMVK
jgi:hypothetical protein